MVGERVRPGIYRSRAQEARATGRDHISCGGGLTMRPSKYAVFDKSSYFQKDGWYVLYETKTKKPIKKKVMNQQKADELNVILKGSGFAWSRVENSVAAKIK